MPDKANFTKITAFLKNAEQSVEATPITFEPEKKDASTFS